MNCVVEFGEWEVALMVEVLLKWNSDKFHVDILLARVDSKPTLTLERNFKTQATFCIRGDYSNSLLEEKTSHSSYNFKLSNT